jgi:hypothetical protein
MKPTPEEIKLFLQGFEKMLQLLVRQNERAAKRALEKMKRAQEGEQD